MADSTNNSNNSKNIIDNLLIKEEAGDLHYFQDQKNQPDTKNLSNASTNSTTSSTADPKDDNDQNSVDDNANGIAVAPTDDSFASDKQAQGMAQDKSELVFHPDDKTQIVRLAESVPVDDSKKYSIEKIIDKLLTKQNLNLDEANRILFSNLILDFFRNRKSVISTRELLGAKITTEGKTLSAEIVDNVISVIKSLKAKIDNEGGLVVGAGELKKQQLEPKVEPIEKLVEKPQAPKEAETSGEIQKVSPPDIEEETEEIGEEESNIFLNNLEKQEAETSGEIQKVSPPGTEEETEDENDIVTPVKFGMEPKGLDAKEEEEEKIAADNQSEIDKSLEEIKNIMPEIAQETTKGSPDEEEAELLKELAIDTKSTEGATSSSVPQEDLHDVGQLMTEEDGDDSQEKDEEDGFAIKKIKPADISPDNSTENEENGLENKESAPEIVKIQPEATKVDATPENEALSNIAQSSENEAATGQEEGTNILEQKNDQPDNNTTTNTAAPASSDKKNELDSGTPKEEKKPAASLPRVIRPNQTFDVKPKVSDVQEVYLNGKTAKHELTGPVEELGNMTLKNFRFMGTNAEDRVNKILEKIDILEQDSYTKKAAGIKAWRNSPVNKLYLSIGAESMTQGQDIKVLINQKKLDGEDTLDAEEFGAISDLNKKLRF